MRLASIAQSGLKVRSPEAVLFRHQRSDRRLDRAGDVRRGRILPNDAVLVGEDVDAADPGTTERCIGAAGDDALLVGTARCPLLEDRQDDVAGLTYGCSQLGVSAIGSSAEIHVECDDRRSIPVKLANRLRVIFAWPGPAAQFRQAACIDLDDNRFTGWLPRQQLGPAGGKRIFERTEKAAC